MKLLSVNMEGVKHTDLINDLIIRENPDCLCLQEAPERFSQILAELGYRSTFAPMQTKNKGQEPYVEGVILASRLPHAAEIKYYFKSETAITDEPTAAAKPTPHHPYILSEIIGESGQIFHIATTHVMVTKDGLPDEHQEKGVNRLLEMLDQEPPHILCGDFNMPRSVNRLYEKFLASYTDCIPDQYTSSLDRDLHRLGQRTDLNAPIFDEYMVDYIFAQAPYAAHDTRLEFGVSDHAAVLADIKLNGSSA